MEGLVAGAMGAVKTVRTVSHLGVMVGHDRLLVGLSLSIHGLLPPGDTALSLLSSHRGLRAAPHSTIHSTPWS